MRKLLGPILVILLMLGLCACGSDGKEPVGDTPKETEKSGSTSESGSARTTKTTVDYDLTTMNATMVYSTVYDMLYNSDGYVGKYVKMSGEYTVFYSRVTEKYYPAVIIADATACCSQGMEFVLKGDPTYPDSYPEVGAEVTVVGKLEIYYEDEDRYVHLVDSTLS